MSEHLRGNRGDSQVAARMQATKEAFIDAAQNLKEASRTLTNKVVHDVQGRSHEIQKTVSNYVKKKPLAALGGAVLAGMVLSFIFRRRK